MVNNTGAIRNLQEASVRRDQALVTLQTTVAENFQTLQDIKRYLAIISSKLRLTTTVPATYDETSRVETKQDDSIIENHQMFDEMLTPIDIEIVDKLISAKEGISFQNEDTVFIPSSNAKGTKKSVEDDLYSIFGNEILEGWNEDGAVSVEFMKTNMQAQLVENSKGNYPQDNYIVSERFSYKIALHPTLVSLHTSPAAKQTSHHRSLAASYSLSPPPVPSLPLKFT